MVNELSNREFAELAESLHAAPTVGETAHQVVGFARTQLDADHAGIGFIRNGSRVETVAGTDPVVEQIDGWESSLGGGCTLDHSWERSLVVPDLTSDGRWGKWKAAVVEAGIRSMLVGEFTGDQGRRMGTLNLYWKRRREFGADDLAFVSIFTRHAAVALSSSMEIAGLNTALDGRKLIGQAQGMLMERFDLAADQAFEVLKRYSQNHNLKLRTVAQQLVSTRQLPSEDGFHASRPRHHQRGGVPLSETSPRPGPR